MKRLAFVTMLFVVAIVAGTAGPVEASRPQYPGQLGSMSGVWFCDCTVCTADPSCWCAVD